MIALAQAAQLGPYELVSHVATGGMAEVFLARRAGPHGFQKTVAVKRIIPQLLEDAEFVAMFIDEARVSAQLSHPNIVQVFDFGEHENELYMAMEFIQGTSVAKLIRSLMGRPEALPLEASFHIVLSVLRALDYAHAATDERGSPLHIVHRDVSPGNILLHESGAVKLTDFGIARAAQSERRTEQGQLKGKLGYMSPEQVVGRELDARSDLFTLGVVFAELLTGRPLFSGPNELDVLIRIRDADVRSLERDAIPDDVRAVLLRALARRPEERFSSAAEFAMALEEVLRKRRLPASPGHLLLTLRELNLVAVRTESLTFALPRAEPLAVTRDALVPPPPRLRSASEPTVAPPARPGRAARPSGQIPVSWRVRQGERVRESVTYPELIELLVTGSVAPGAQVSREGGNFQSPSAFPELARVSKNPALAWSEDMPPGVIERASIDLRHLPSRIARLAMDRETGALILKTGEKRKKIFFVDGVPEYVASTSRIELLGECLIRRGQALRMEVEMALAMLPEFDGRLGDALVGLGVLRPNELFRAVLDQIEERVLEVFAWRDGEVAFLPNARCHEETLPLGVKTLELVGRGITEYYSQEELRAVLAVLRDQPIERNPSAPVRLGALRLPTPEERVLRGLRGKYSLREVIAQAELFAIADEDEVRRAIFVGLSTDLLICPSWPRTLPSRQSICD